MPSRARFYSVRLYNAVLRAGQYKPLAGTGGAALLQSISELDALPVFKISVAFFNKGGHPFALVICAKQ